MAKPILVGYDAGRGDRAPLEFGLAAASFTGAPGGVSRRVVSEARCPVMVLARGVDTGLEALVDEVPARSAEPQPGCRFSD
jgi:hypothetical protein